MISRRRVVQGGLIMSGASVTTGCATSTALLAQPASKATNNYLLVHGAWHGGWCWNEVRSLLLADGHRVYAPSLSGLGDRIHLREQLEVGLDTHINDIVNLIKFEELDNVVLVGHSYAGMVISGVADQVGDKLDELIYLDALVPDDGGSLLDPYGELTDEQVSQIVANVPVDENNSLLLPPLEFLGISEDHPAAESLMRRLTPHPMKTLVDRLSYSNEGTQGVAKSFIYCSAQQADDGVKRKLEKIKASDDWAYYEIATGHNAMTIEPEKLVQLFYQIA